MWPRDAKTLDIPGLWVFPIIASVSQLRGEPHSKRTLENSPEGGAWKSDWAGGMEDGWRRELACGQPWPGGFAKVASECLRGYGVGGE